MNKLAIMQPYIFPYIGYFNLIHSVDKFVFFDDVNFIKRGWINRNKILSGGKEFLFSVPLSKPSQNKKINDTKLSSEQSWRGKLLRNISHSYSKADGFSDAYPLVERIVNFETDSISDLAMLSVIEICKYLDINRVFCKSSEVSGVNIDLRGQDRIIDICKLEGASAYNNAIGGVDLYSDEIFLKNNINLNFIQPLVPKYSQGSGDFISHLSIIDILMFNVKSDVSSMVSKYNLIRGRSNV
jgi:hypothetical protein